MMVVGDIIAYRLLSASRSLYTLTLDADKAFNPQSHSNNHTATITQQHSHIKHTATESPHVP